MTERPTLSSLSTRIAVIETRNDAKDKADADRDLLLKEMNEKLTSLVSLKDQGRGVMWLLSILWMSGIIGGIGALWHWLRG